MRTLIRSTLILFAVASLTTTGLASLYVTPDGSGLMNGSSPANALKQITQGNQTGMGGAGGINAAIAAFLGSMPDEQYKHDFPSPESGPLATSYSTTFTSISGDASGFDITYVGGPVVDPTYLLVKDGNHSPAWYLFDISAWDGTSTLSGTNFWNVAPKFQGSISHVTIYGSVNTTVIPEPGTIAVWGLLAVAGYFGAKKYQAKA